MSDQKGIWIEDSVESDLIQGVSETFGISPDKMWEILQYLRESIREEAIKKVRGE